jgi:hypothetical protein
LKQLTTLIAKRVTPKPTGGQAPARKSIKALKNNDLSLDKSIARNGSTVAMQTILTNRSRNTPKKRGISLGGVII